MYDETTRKRALAILIAAIGLATFIVGWASYGPTITWSTLFPPSSGGGVLPINDKEYLYRLAQHFSQQGDDAYAADLARRITYIDASDTRAHKFLAVIALKHQDYDEARRRCEETLRVAPHDAAARLGLASALAGLHQRDKARDVLSALIADATCSVTERAAAQTALAAIGGEAPPAAPISILPRPDAAASIPSPAPSAALPPVVR